MTDKEIIIINGININKCEHHRKCILPDNIGCKIDDILCCDKPNCEYKQLQRKTAECEKLKIKLDKWQNYAIQKEQALDEIKESITNVLKKVF